MNPLPADYAPAELPLLHLAWCPREVHFPGEEDGESKCDRNRTCTRGSTIELRTQESNFVEIPFLCKSISESSTELNDLTIHIAIICVTGTPTLFAKTCSRPSVSRSKRIDRTLFLVPFCFIVAPTTTM